MLVFGIVISYLRYQNLMKNINEAVKDYQSKSGFFVGDSHIKAIDTYTYDSTIANLGQGGEDIEVSIAKIKILLNKNTHKTVYLSFAENNIVNNPEMKDETRRRQFKYELFSSSERLMFILGHVKEFIHFVTFDNMQSHGFGNGRGMPTTKIFNPKTVKNPRFVVMRFHYSDTSINRKKLQNMITDLNDYLISKQSKLILINVPATVLYKEYIPKTVFDTYNSLLNIFAQKDIEILNYENLNLNDSLFQDMNHLNVKGSKTIMSVIFQATHK